jgi:hypothetical protein
VHKLKRNVCTHIAGQPTSPKRLKQGTLNKAPAAPTEPIQDNPTPADDSQMHFNGPTGTSKFTI